MPIILKPSIEYCSQGKHFLHRVTSEGCRYLPRSFGDTSTSPAECELYFSRTLKRGGGFLTDQGWLHGRISNETSRIVRARSYCVQHHYRVRAGRACLGRWQTRVRIPGFEFGGPCSLVSPSLLSPGVLASLPPPLVAIIKIGRTARASRAQRLNFPQRSGGEALVDRDDSANLIL